VAESAILPYQVQWMEWGLDVLASIGLTEPQKLSSLLLVNVYVRGQTQLTLGFEADFGTDEFNFGLRTVLDGIQALIARRPAGARSGPTPLRLG
jgi:hypothetical protein